MINIDDVKTRPEPSEKIEEWKPHPRAGRNLVYYFAGTFLRVFFWLYGRWKVIGLENIPAAGGVLLAANHCSLLDPPLLGGAVFGYRRVRFMAKVELWSKPIGRFVMDRILCFPIRRGAADRFALRFALDALSCGDVVAMFPEGERSETGKLQQVQPGIALLIHKSRVPVVPVAIIGTFEMLPPRAKKLKRVPIVIAFGKPMVFPADCPRERITSELTQAIAELLTANGHPTEVPEKSK